MDKSAIAKRLQYDCSKCASLCCVTLPFFKKDGFAYDKPAGMPCHFLDDRHRCSIHDSLNEKGFPTCTIFGCAGAGPRVTQEIYNGDSWQANIVLLGEMMETFSLMREVHELANALLQVSKLDLEPQTAQTLAEMWGLLDFERDWTPDSLIAFFRTETPNEILGFAQPLITAGQGTQESV